MSRWCGKIFFPLIKYLFFFLFHNRAASKSTWRNCPGFFHVLINGLVISGIAYFLSIDRISTLEFAIKKTSESSVRESPHVSLWQYLLTHLPDKFRRSYVLCDHRTIYPADLPGFPDKHGPGCLLQARGSRTDHLSYDRTIRIQINSLQNKRRYCRIIIFDDFTVPSFFS